MNFSHTECNRSYFSFAAFVHTLVVINPPLPGIEKAACPADATIVSLRSETVEAPAARRRSATGDASARAAAQPRRELPAPPVEASAEAAKPAAHSAPAPAALGPVRAAAAGADRRRLLVRYRRAGDVDR